MKSNKKQPPGDVQKENFIAILSSCTPDQINQMIRERGKETKPMPLCILSKK